MAIILDRSQRKLRDQLLERNYENAKAVRSNPVEIEKNNKNFKDLLNYSLSKIPADKRKAAEATLSGDNRNKVEYVKPSADLINSLSRKISSNDDTDFNSVVKQGGFSMNVFRNGTK